MKQGFDTREVLEVKTAWELVCLSCTFVDSAGEILLQIVGFPHSTSPSTILIMLTERLGGDR